MNEMKLAHQPILEPAREEEVSTQAREIRLLDDLELALAGGGDTIVTWP